MKNIILTICIIAATAILLFSCGDGASNHTTFKEVKIGKQVWMAENLNVFYFKNGDAIPVVKTAEEWAKAGENQQPACCYYENNAENGKTYGLLYNWYAVNDQRGLAPEGWHVPTANEWYVLREYIGSDDLMGLGADILDSSEVTFAKKLKSTSGWADKGNGTNESGFNGLPAGVRLKDGSFHFLGQYVGWFSSTENNTLTAWGCSLRFDTGFLNYNNKGGKSYGCSVRCLRD